MAVAAVVLVVAVLPAERRGGPLAPPRGDADEAEIRGVRAGRVGPAAVAVVVAVVPAIADKEERGVGLEFGFGFEAAASAFVAAAADAMASI